MSAARLLSILALGSVSLIFTATTARSQASTPTLKTPAGFDLASEMTALYGNYDSVRGVSLLSQAGERFDVRAFFIAEVPDSREVILATFAVPEGDDFKCHACSPSIGAALFEKDAAGWMLKASELPSSFMFGEEGDTGDASIVKFGRHQYGIKLEDGGTHGGRDYMTTALFLPWDGKFSIAAVATTMEDSSEGQGCPSEKISERPEERLPPCYKYHRNLEFVPGRNPDNYDLVIKTSGTGLIGSDVADISGTKRFHLEDGKFVGPNPSDRPTLPPTSVTVPLPPRREGDVTTKWKIFSNRAGWSINYPADWTVSSCRNCSDPTDPNVFVSFFPPQEKDYGEGVVMVEHLADKPQGTGERDWLASIKQTANLNPIATEETTNLNGLPALKIRYRTSSGGEMQEVYVVSGSSTFSIGFSGGKPGVTTLEDYGNYVRYLQMVASFGMKQ